MRGSPPCACSPPSTRPSPRSAASAALDHRRISLDPGAPSIIPGRAEILFQFRDVSVGGLERMEATLRALIRESNRRERCTATLHALSCNSPALCDPGLMDALSGAAEALCPGGWQARCRRAPATMPRTSPR